MGLHSDPVNLDRPKGGVPAGGGRGPEGTRGQAGWGRQHAWPGRCTGSRAPTLTCMKVWHSVTKLPRVISLNRSQVSATLLASKIKAWWCLIRVRATRKRIFEPSLNRQSQIRSTVCGQTEMARHRLGAHTALVPARHMPRSPPRAGRPRTGR